MVGARHPTAPFPALALLLFLSSLAGAPPTQAQESAAGSLRGSVYDKDFDAPLAGVRLTLVEARLSAVSSAQGQFLFERVPTGRHTLIVSKDGYERKVVSNVAISAGQLTDLRIDLSSEIVDLEELVITGTDLLSSGEVGILEVRAAATVIQDAISADLIKRAGASDVTGALKLVTGASVSEGKYATVRGLSDRYTGTTLNGVRVPSADPRRRAVQMDLFPTGTVESVIVTKTFTPDVSADFTGGGVDIRTKGVPDGLQASISTTSEFDTSASGNDRFLSYRGGGVNLAGLGADRYELDSRTSTPLPQLPRFRSSPTPEEMSAARAFDRYTRSFSPVMGTNRRIAGWNAGISLLGGNRIEVGGGGVVGLLGAVTWTHKYDFYEDGVNNLPVVSVANQGFSIKSARSDSRGLDEVLMGGLAELVYQPSRGQELTLCLLRNQSAEDEARFQVKDAGNPVVEQNQSLHYTERSVDSDQLHGDHGFGPWRLKWSLSRNGTRQQEPDVRFFRNNFVVDSFVSTRPANSTEPENTRRIWRDIKEDNWQLSSSAELTFKDGSEEEGALRAGFNLDRTNRVYTQRSFAYYFATQFPGARNDPKRPHYFRNTTLTSYKGTGPDDLWSDVFLSPHHIGLADNDPPAPNQILWYIAPLGDDVDYEGDQDIWAAYAMAEVPLLRWLKFTGGLRAERTRMDIVPSNEAFGKVQTIVRFPSGDRGFVPVPEAEAASRIRDTAVLPSAGLTWKLRSNMSLRSSWTRTLARPTFRELAPVATEEFISGDEYVGNPALQLSRITNYDARWEWFPSQESVLSAGVFRKEIENPIELISFAVASSVLIQPVNYERGRVSGFELEAHTPLGGLGHWARGFQGGMNFTGIASRVDVPLEEQESLAAYALDQETRRLLGQPKYLFNANITWDGWLSASLFYNYVGETLRTGAARGPEDGIPNVFDKPRDTLDFTASKDLGKHLHVGVKAKNLLRRDARTVSRLPDGEEALKTLRSTSSLYSVSLGWSW